MERNNTNNFIELTPQSYLEITTDCSKEIQETYDEVTGLEMEFDDKAREIKMYQKQLRALKKKLAKAKKEKKDIKYELDSKKRSIKVDVRFLNRVNKSMTRRDETHLVNYQTRKVR